MVIIKRRVHHLYIDKVVDLGNDLYVCVGMYKKRCNSCSMAALPVRLSESEVEELKKIAVPNNGRAREE